MIGTAPARSKRRLTCEDILPLAECATRKRHRGRIAKIKRRRRVEVGPYATFYFQNYDTMRQQVQEMLYIEKGGDAQLEDELSGYNPLIPQGCELIATIMLEIDEPARPVAVLSRLGGIENRHFSMFPGSEPAASPIPPAKTKVPRGRHRRYNSLKFPLPATRSLGSKRRACRSLSVSITSITRTWQCCRRQ